jgi:hypothetical protein
MKIPEETQQRARHGHRVHEQAPVEDGSDGVEAEVERGHDTKVAAAAAYRPEQVGVLVH